MRYPYIDGCYHKNDQAEEYATTAFGYVHQGQHRRQYGQYQCTDNRSRLGTVPTKDGGTANDSRGDRGQHSWLHQRQRGCLDQSQISGYLPGQASVSWAYTIPSFHSLIARHSRETASNCNSEFLIKRQH